jgi:glucose/arabinose dehydrogenase
MGFLSLAVMLLGGCQTQEGPTSESREGYNTLAVGLTVTQPKFADSLASQGYNTPMSMEFAPDGRLFILEKSGAVKISQGASAALTFLTLTVDQNTERGLLGIAFDPNWTTDKYVYIYYSRNGAGANRVSRFKVSTTDANKADPASETVLFDLSPLTNSAYHNGGGLHFGKDGFLYLTTGDNRLPTNAPSLNVQLGKILRFSKVYSGTAGIPTIPTDNPFYTTATGNNRAIWGLGLRNPFTFAVQPGTGRIFINDVGEDGYEEINEATQSGQNFGWPSTEGPTSAAGITGPIGGYVNGTGVNEAECAIVGATFYNPPANAQQYPADFVGDYFYGDHCSANIKSIDLSAPASPTVFATSIGGHLMDLKTGPNGYLYYLTLEGIVGIIKYTGTDKPTISRQPVTQTVSVNQSVTFTVEANGGNLTYQWQKAGVNIVGATAATYSIASAQLADNGSQYRVIVTNPFGTENSTVATLTVISNQPPAPVITTPLVTDKFNGGQTISYSGTATDPEDGAIGAASFTWWVDLVHDAHTHPAVPPVSGSASGSFTVPAVNETAPGISYRFYLQVKDSKGLTTTVTRDIQPNKVTVTVNSVPSGLQVNIDGQPKTTPYVFTGVVGVMRQIDAISPQTLSGANYSFSNWSDAGAQSHAISTPAANATFTATFGTAGGTVNLPGKIEAENYKTGGEGVGYHDLTPTNNQGGQYRPTDGVDIEASSDAGAGYNVGWTQAGEWLDYSVNVTTAGNYALTARMASGVAGTKTAALLVDGASKGNFSFTDASGWQSWNNVVLSGIILTTGTHTIRIGMTTGDFNLNYVNVAAGTNLAPTAAAGLDKSISVNTLVSFDGSASSDPDNGPQALTYAWSQVSGPSAALSNPNTSQPTFTPATAGTYVFRLTVNDGAATGTDDIQVIANSTAFINLPGRIEAEAYQTGGEGFGYHDTSPTDNKGGQYRPAEGVDIEVAGDAGGGYNVGWIDAGEWLDYDVNVASAGLYTLTARMASGGVGTKSVVVTLDGGTTAIATMSFSDASGWQIWQSAAAANVSLPAGNHVLRFTMPNGNLNLNYVDVAVGGATNLLLNGDFANGIVSWNTYFAAPATGTIANEAGAARISITNQGVNVYDIQLWQAVPLTAGKLYTLDFDIKSETTPKAFRVIVEHNGTPWTKYVDAGYTVTAAANTYQHFTVTWTQSVTDAGGRIVFDHGFTNVSDVWMDNVVLK